MAKAATKAKKTGVSGGSGAIPLETARRLWHRCQGLAEPQTGALADVVGRTGWIRTLGGCDIYLALRARVPELSRAALDAAVESSALHVTPAVRGCIYLVPRAHAALVLRSAAETWYKRAERDLERVQSSWKEIESVSRAVLEILDRRGLTSDALRKAMPAGSVRSFGNLGKKVGLASPLPVALRHLELLGDIERAFEGGRLDTERYVWRRPKKNVLAGTKVPADVAGRTAELGRIFLSFAAPVTAKDFAEWAGLSQRDARAGLVDAGGVPIAVDGYATEAFVHESALADLASAPPPTTVSLLSFEDNYLTLHGGPGLIVDPKHHRERVASWGTSRPTTLGETKHLAARTIVAGDRMVGFWEYDPDADRIVTRLLDPIAPAMRRALEDRIDSTARFLREEVGHARSNSLDTTDSIRERARALTSGGPKRAAKRPATVA